MAYFTRIKVSLGLTTSPDSILEKLRNFQRISFDHLNGEGTCYSFTEGDSLGEGKSGIVFEIEESSNKGMAVVLKQFEVRDYTKLKEDTYILSSSLNEVVMSSLVSEFFDGDVDFCISFPYFQGFFTCGDEGYIVMEKLDETLSQYIKGSDVTADEFRPILFQVLYACLFLLRNKMMHNDMHSKNIMIRGVKDISYRNVKLSSVKTFVFRDGNESYHVPNIGLLAKIVDYDFAAKFTSPKVTPRKIYKKENSDNWNLKFEYAKSYDIMTFMAYITYYVFERTLTMEKKELTEIKRIVENVLEYIIEEVESQVGEIEELRKIDKSYSIIAAKFMNIVTNPQFRPYMKYDNISLLKILNVNAFRQYHYAQSGGFVISSM